MKNGFTLVEVLAVVVILGILLILVIPAYNTVYTNIKRSNLNSKITDIKIAAKKYGNKIKDEVKNATGSCINITVEELIKKGHLTSEEESKPVIYNPTDNTPLNGIVKICYCANEYDIEAYYVKEFVQNNVYYEGDVVISNNKLYECVIDYKNNSGIDGTNEKGKRFFREVTC